MLMVVLAVVVLTLMLILNRGAKTAARDEAARAIRGLVPP